MTGYPSLNSAVNAIKSGAVEYIVKPFRLDEMDRIIAKNIDNLGTEIENIKLKERIKELEEKLHEKDGSDPDSSNEKQETVTSENIQQNRFSDRTMKDDANVVKGRNTYINSVNQQNKVDENLRKLNELKSKGLIDSEEFKKKEELLNKKYV